MTTEKSTGQLSVLDHGFVRLVDYMGGDLAIIRAARVSYNADWREHGENNDAKLIRYLWKNEHTSPFEACTLTFEVKAPIFVLRQWHRHRTQSYNELSARYVELDEGFYVPSPETIGEQSKSSKQSRDITGGKVATNAEMSSALIQKHCKRAFDTYQGLLKDGCPRELARSVLPVAAYSRMFTTMNLLNFFRFAKLRLHPHAQWEIRQYAKVMVELVKLFAPVAAGAFEKSLPDV